MEAIAAGARIEDLPYTPSMDQEAQCHEMAPGDWIFWPPHSPHRVENHGELNVSLSTEHATLDGLRKLRVLRANYYLRKHLRLKVAAIDTSGPAYAMKYAVDAAIRTVRTLGVGRSPRFIYPTTFRVDPDAPGGISPLPSPGP
jgi:hypothetical protein